MTRTAVSGPFVAYGYNALPSGGGQNNEEAGPGAMFGGNGFLDPRVGYDNRRSGWVASGTEYRRVLSATPQALGAANIAALAHVVSGTAMTLATASTGITVLGAAGLYVNGSGNTVPANALVLDGNPSLTSYGLADSAGNYANNSYANSTMIARAVQVTGVSGGAGGAFLVSGYDVYGYPMTETITAAAGVATNNGKKAFKFIASVVPQFTDAHNYSVGTTDIFGLPMRADTWDQALVWFNSALITASTGFVAADTTSPATATTGDPRGTYALQSASDGTKRLAIAVGPPQVPIATAAGLYGVTPA